MNRIKNYSKFNEIIEKTFSGRYWTRTSDPHDVNVVL